MTTERMSHTATLLPDGTVLVAGGSAILSGWPVWSSAELYDPAAKTFSLTGSMTTPRQGHTATLLPDGRVLIAGGLSVGGDTGVNSAQASAELYDPSTGAFSATGSMSTARAWHTATLLNTGQVLIVGGNDDYNDGYPIVLASAELYDPLTGTFAATGNLGIARFLHKATLLANGRVLIDGGYGNADSPPAPELYDPATGTFSPAGNPAFKDTYPASASILPNGDVLETLAYSCDFDDQAETYDPSAGTFNPTGNMTANRGYTTATLLPEGKVLIDGRDEFDFGGSSEIYDPATGTFTATCCMFLESEEGHTATLLADGTVLLAGGWICCGFSVANAEIYLPAMLMPSPVLYSLPGGTQGAILHADTRQVVSAANPARAGEAIEVYGAGLVEGSIIPPQVAISGRLAQVLFFGDAPEYPGLNQINVLVPNGLSSGPAVPVRINYLTRPSNEVTIALQ
ncbi:MAG TPA: kelch repeat-containing protein [Bryobacteraceae bacterium]